MDYQEIWRLIQPILYPPDEIPSSDERLEQGLLLTHYTTLETLEKILVNNEIWFSNPLFMNDIEEVTQGLNLGTQAITNSSLLKSSLDTQARWIEFLKVFESQRVYHYEKHLLDTYVFCLSYHPDSNSDGQLSMWRGYGDFGSGAAIVFDSSSFPLQDTSPLSVGEVDYVTHADRVNIIDGVVNLASKFFADNDIPDRSIEIVSHILFQKIWNMALFTKHKGFEEENEWRVVYFNNRDPNGLLDNMKSYVVGSQGFEPKLKFKMQPIQGVTSPNISFENSIKSIILGHQRSSALAMASTRRMLDLIGRQQLTGRLKASTIPFRGP